VTAHPTDLIAALDDGMDLDQKDEVTRHVAACDRCRTTARTMQRIDSLIAIPEPVLPLPARATPREGLPQWASFVTVGVTLVVAIAVTVGALRQPTAGSLSSTPFGTTATCDLLTAAEHSTGILPASAKAEATGPDAQVPARLSGSWSACIPVAIKSGQTVSPGPALLVLRTTSTARWEVNALLADVNTIDRTTPTTQLGQDLADWGQTLYGNVTPRAGDSSTDRWITGGGSKPGDLQGMVVFAEPYFFVLIAPVDVAGQLADAIVAELRERRPTLSQGPKIDACNVITRVSASVGLRAEGATTPATEPQRHHWAEISVASLASIGMSANVCSFHNESGDDQHIWIREAPTTLQQATALLPVISGSLTPSTVGGWVQIDAGMWMAHGQWLARDFPSCLRCPVDYSVVAVLDGSQFVALTQETDAAAIRTARAVLAEIKRP
jgi:hypothetical protein